MQGHHPDREFEDIKGNGPDCSVPWHSTKSMSALDRLSENGCKADVYDPKILIEVPPQLFRDPNGTLGSHQKIQNGNVKGFKQMNNAHAELKDIAGASKLISSRSSSFEPLNEKEKNCDCNTKICPAPLHPVRDPMNLDPITVLQSQPEESAVQERDFVASGTKELLVGKSESISYLEKLIDANLRMTSKMQGDQNQYETYESEINFTSQRAPERKSDIQNKGAVSRLDFSLLWQNVILHCALRSQIVFKTKMPNWPIFISS